MSTRAWKSATTLAIVIGGYYGTKELGTTVVAPGKNTGFTGVAHGASAQRQLVLSTSNTGDLTCWVRLQIVADTIPTGLLTARTSTNTPLALATLRADASHWWIDISRSISPADSLKRDKFVWASGEQVIVSITATTETHERPPLVLAAPSEWIVYLANEEEDTPAKASRRRNLGWTSLGLFALLILGSIGKVTWLDAKEESGGPASAAQVIRTLADAIEVQSKERTAKLRTMLTRRLSGAGKTEAIRAAGFEPESREGKAAFYEASRLLADRMKNFRDDFERLERMLDWRRGS
jgi:hypothetical protein